MNVRHLISLAGALLSLAASAAAQGYAGLGTGAEGFALPRRGTALQFPRDHGPHPDFRIEWWYLTANLQDSDGSPLGIQWTLFRSALRPGEAAGWSSPQVWMAHAAVTTPDTHVSAERLERGGSGAAGVTAAPFAAWIGDWQMRAPDGALNILRLQASGSRFSYDLRLEADTPIVLHGDRGYSVKSAEGQASYYFSQPRYRISGSVTLDGETLAVTGHGWLDREWSSQPLAGDQTGWDWFSLSFDSGGKLMGFVLRGSGEPFTSGTLLTAEGDALPLPPGAFRAEPAGRAPGPGEAPAEWHVTLPGHGIDVTVTALNPQAWMAHSFTYWEGPVTVSGNRTGTGYLEMTGYR